jgi:hypothetical protein
MLKSNDFYEIAYRYYPKNISGVKNRTEYVDSKEYQELVKITTSENGLYRTSDLECVKNEIEYSFNEKLLDHTVKSLNDRCYNWQFKLNTVYRTKKKDVMCINLSKIVPFFFIYVLEVEFCEKLKRLKYKPRRNLNLENGTYNNDIQKIEDILKTHITILNPFPKDYLELLIPNISFEYMDLGKLSMFNAFFLNEFTTRFV